MPYSGAELDQRRMKRLISQQPFASCWAVCCEQLIQQDNEYTEGEYLALSPSPAGRYPQVIALIGRDTARQYLAPEGEL